MPMRIQRKHLTTEAVLLAVETFRTHAYDTLVDWGFPEKVVIAAFQREVKAGRLDYGVSIARPFLTGHDPKVCDH